MMLAFLLQPYVILCFLLGYGLGSIPFGLLLTRLAGTDDIRTIGSRNIGATNVLRTGRKDLAAATLLLDALKGSAALWLVQYWGAGSGEPQFGVLAAALGAFLGHVFPVWLQFKGGKGVATFLGILLAFWWLGAVIFVVLWLVVAWLSRYSSLSALVASLGVWGIYSFWQLQTTGSMAGGSLVLGLMVVLLFWKHKENIIRLRLGTEGKIGKK